MCSEVTVKVWGIHVMKKKRKGCGGEDIQKREVLSLERKSEWVIEN